MLSLGTGERCAEPTVLLAVKGWFIIIIQKYYNTLLHTLPSNTILRFVNSIILFSSFLEYMAFISKPCDFPTKPVVTVVTVPSCSDIQSAVL
jgi:uncharacterized membrane protein